MTKGKESQVPRRQGCSRSSASCTLYSMGPVSMDSILAKVSASVTSLVLPVSIGVKEPESTDTESRRRLMPSSCPDGCLSGASTGPVEADDAAAGGPEAPVSRGAVSGAASPAPSKATGGSCRPSCRLPGWSACRLLLWSSARTSHSLPRSRAMKSVRRCSRGIRAPGFRAARLGTAPRPRA